MNNLLNNTRVFDVKFLCQAGGFFRARKKVTNCELQKFATSGNRTRASRVAGENSTTEPTLLDASHSRGDVYFERVKELSRLEYVTQCLVNKV